MTPQERVVTAVRGGRPDRTPFIYPLPSSTTERELRNRGMCMEGHMPSYHSYLRNTNTQSVHYQDEGGHNLVRTTYSTPRGEVSTVVEPVGFTEWKREFLFKSPEDYKVLLHMIENTVVEPRYEDALRTMANLGEDFASVEFTSYSPLQEIIYRYMGTERFCYEWADNRDEILKLYEALADRNRKILHVCACGPHEIHVYDGNLVPRMIGRENFIRYFMPNYEEATAIMHEKGKVIGNHLDDDNGPFMDLIAETAFDFIIAYDAAISPPVKEARRAWPGKTLWLNYPSSWHLLSLEEVKQGTIRLIEEAEPGDGFIIGITEDVPPDRLLGNCRAIMDGIDEYEDRI